MTFAPKAEVRCVESMFHLSASGTIAVIESAAAQPDANRYHPLRIAYFIATSIRGRRRLLECQPQPSYW